MPEAIFMVFLFDSKGAKVLLSVFRLDSEGAEAKTHKCKFGSFLPKTHKYTLERVKASVCGPHKGQEGSIQLDQKAGC